MKYFDDAMENLLMDVAIHEVMKNASNKYCYNFGEHHLGLTFHEQKDMDEFMTTAVYHFLKRYEKKTRHSKFLNFKW